METTTMMDKVWLANIITGGVVVTVLGWLLIRFIQNYDTRLSKTEEEAAEIKKNYIRRFEEVNEKIDETKEELKEHFTTKIEEVIRDKSNYRIEQSRAIGVIETKIDILLNNNKHRS